MWLKDGSFNSVFHIQSQGRTYRGGKTTSFTSNVSADQPWSRKQRYFLSKIKKMGRKRLVSCVVVKAELTTGSLNKWADPAAWRSRGRNQKKVHFKPSQVPEVRRNKNWHGNKFRLSSFHRAISLLVRSGFYRSFVFACSVVSINRILFFIFQNAVSIVALFVPLLPGANDCREKCLFLLCHKLIFRAFA